jgi:alpha/beta superfamily hydrolase
MALACAGPGVRAMVFVGLPAGMAAEVAFAALEGEALFLSGDNDAFSTAESLKKIAAPLGERALVEIVAGVDHFWFGQESRVAATVGRFFKGRL